MKRLREHIFVYVFLDIADNLSRRMSGSRTLLIRYAFFNFPLLDPRVAGDL